MATYPHRRAPVAVGAAVAALLLAACGSNLSPDDVALAQGGTQSSVTTPELDSTSPASGGASNAPPGTVDPTSATSPDQAPGGTGSGPGPETAGDPEAGGGGEQEPAPATGDGDAGDCAGFANQRGITDDTITLANVSDISGPVPGIFKPAQDGAAAFVSYFNATSDLCGRKLELIKLDTRAEASGDQQGYATACDRAFAVVGSMSSQDQGGAATAGACGIPDIRSAGVTPQRIGCGSCFAAYSVKVDRIAASQPRFWTTRERSASQHVAVFYVNVEAAKVNAESFAAGFDKGGMNVDLVQGIDTSAFNYVPFVQQMKDKGIEFVMYFGPYQFAIRLQQAMKQQSFTPKVYLQDPTIYTDTYVEQAAGVGEGSYVFSPIELFDSTRIPEMVLYRQWLNQTSPGSIPDYYGLFAWSATRLFVEQATELGGKLTRESLVAALRGVREWDGNGVHAPMDVGGKTTSGCVKMIRLSGSRWTQVSSGDFLCGPLISTGVG
ncbi:ABC transporter substrate-binding protein [Nocardioides sp. R-C-SC26]|uniref:ABC transporter substrate-binding protein n=1 Tax=Nocardioides sp. R-C-SC26 TaxID=2870414 RepID=UPI001E30C227|nr:ABC transporter substrate-binding protein [Nocardioides sp. R-C-SC26]